MNSEPVEGKDGHLHSTVGTEKMPVIITGAENSTYFWAPVYAFTVDGIRYQRRPDSGITSPIITFKSQFDGDDGSDMLDSPMVSSDWRFQLLKEQEPVWAGLEWTPDIYL